MKQPPNEPDRPTTAQSGHYIKAGHDFIRNFLRDLPWYLPVEEDVMDPDTAEETLDRGDSFLVALKGAYGSYAMKHVDEQNQQQPAPQQQAAPQVYQPAVGQRRY